MFSPIAYIDKSTGKCVGENIEAIHKIFAQYNVKLEGVCSIGELNYRGLPNNSFNANLAFMFSNASST